MTATEIVKKDIRQLTREQLEEVLLAFGEKKFRANQIYDWLWTKSARSFDDMTSLSKDLRQRLDAAFIIRPIQEDKIQRSLDGTIKGRFACTTGI